MRYVSTRNSAVQVDFEQVVLSGIAQDGGLFVPLELPLFEAQDIANWSTLPYDELAYRVISPFVGEAIPETDLKRCSKRRAVNSAIVPWRLCIRSIVTSGCWNCSTGRLAPRRILPRSCRHGWCRIFCASAGVAGW